jgi:signal transduction histidine kinase
MADRPHPGTLLRRLVSAFLVVSLISLAVLFVGTVLPHLPNGHLDPHDPVSLAWLLVATAIAVCTAVVLSLVIARRLTRPLAGYIETARRFAEGDHSARPEDLGPVELAELASALVDAADHVERSELARRQLTADIAHELRTPLTALQAGLEELRDGLAPADQETLAALHDQATRLGRIVSDLSELAAAESTGVQVELVDVDLAEVASLALAAREGSLRSAGLQVGADLQPGIVVRADPDRLHQIIGNLLANAQLYCRIGDRVSIQVRGDAGDGLLEVSDTGPGFRPEELPLVFDRTWRGRSADGTRGSGLGLPIVRALTTAMGGSVAVHSIQGSGTTISIRLPRVAESRAR